MDIVPNKVYSRLTGRGGAGRAIDTSGALVDVRLSETRAMAAAKAVLPFRKNSHRDHPDPGDDGWARQLPKGVIGILMAA